MFGRLLGMAGGTFKRGSNPSGQLADAAGRGFPGPGVPQQPPIAGAAPQAGAPIAEQGGLFKALMGRAMGGGVVSPRFGQQPAQNFDGGEGLI